MGKKRAREEGKDVSPADVDKMDEDGSDDEVGKMLSKLYAHPTDCIKGLRYG